MNGMKNARWRCDSPPLIHARYHRNQKPINFYEMVEVLRAEEKMTDVNIAIHMLCDAMDERCAHQVLLTNDSDCAPVLAEIRSRWPDIRLGVVAPLPTQNDENRPSVALALSCPTELSLVELSP